MLGRDEYDLIASTPPKILISVLLWFLETVTEAE
jgi:hypothetical protein